MFSDNDIRNDYFDWLYEKMTEGRVHEHVSYLKLFEYLHKTEFIFSIPNDVNRAKDGTELRYTYAMEKDEDHVEDILYILDGPCSVLEMMVALAIRAETTIMDNTLYGDRTKQWFWSMMMNLGLSTMTDDVFDERFVQNRIDIFLNRQYSYDGRGGLFFIPNTDTDLRNVEIWFQLCWYLDSFN